MEGERGVCSGNEEGLAMWKIEVRIWWMIVKVDARGGMDHMVSGD